MGIYHYRGLERLDKNGRDPHFAQMQQEDNVMTNIQQATIENIEDITALFDEYRVFYKPKYDINSAAAFISERITKSDSAIFLAYIDIQVVEFTQIYPMFSSVSMQKLYVLNDLYVDPAHRGKGIGKTLLNRGKEYTIEHHGKSLILETEINNTAKHLYERLGWLKDLQYLHYSCFPDIK